jgi:hypothetical protein
LTPTKTPTKQPGLDPNRTALRGEERRRSQRVMLRVPVNVYLTLAGKPVTIEAHTLVVNSHGAMLCLAQHLGIDTRMEVEHKGTKERRSGRVTRQPQTSPEGYLVPVEFDDPSGDFWHVSFPPADWKPLEG